MRSKILLLFLFTIFLLPEQFLISQQIKFAAIGDYGKGASAEADVSDMIDSWNVDFVITLGDNNYNNGYASTIDNNIGKDYNQWIYPYAGSYPPGGCPDGINRFFPSPGNHDNNNTSSIADLQPYLNYFTLPNNERYYDFVWDNIHLFSLNSITAEPDGYKQPSVQATWLENKLADCVINHGHWRLVYFHHSPYSSQKQRSASRWTYAEFGAHAVLSAHSHTYERIFRNGIVYFVNGVGGKSLYSCGSLVQGSQGCYDDNFGAMLITVISNTELLFEFYYKDGTLVDSYLLEDNELPVELVSFDGEYIDNSIILNWKTETESRNYGFDLERRNPLSAPFNNVANQGVWEKIAFVPGNGNSSSPKFYSYTDTDITNSSVYHYRLKQIDTDGSFTYSDEILITVAIPKYFFLSQNYPNPFNPITKITFSLPEDSRVKIMIYNLLGEQVAELVNSEFISGSHTISFDANKFTSGIFLYRIEARNFVATKKMTLLK